MASKHTIDFDNFNTKKHFKSIDYVENNSETENCKLISKTYIIKNELSDCLKDNPESFYRRPCRSDCLKKCCNFEEDEYVYKNEKIIEMDES